MDKKEQILHYHRIDGLSQREIARRVGVCTHCTFALKSTKRNKYEDNKKDADRHITNSNLRAKLWSIDIAGE